MYPNLTPTLVGLLGIALAVAAFIAVRRPFLRRLALRQIARRRGEAALVVVGSVLGTAIIVGSLIVGDTLNFSVRQTAYKNLGPIDEIVSSPTVAQGDQAARRIERLRGDSDVDGLLTLRGDQAAVVRGSGTSRTAEPRASVWEVDFAQAAAFRGGVQGGSGLSGPTPAPARRSSTTTWPPSSGPGPGTPSPSTSMGGPPRSGWTGWCPPWAWPGPGPGRRPPATPSSLRAPWSRRPPSQGGRPGPGRPSSSGRG